MANMLGLRNLVLWISIAPVALAMPSKNHGSGATLKNSPNPLPSSGAQAQAAVKTKTLSRSEYVLTVVNLHTAALSTEHHNNNGTPTAIKEFEEPHTIGVGASAILAVPTGWAGRIAITEATYPINDRASLIEGSFLIQNSVPSSPTKDAKFALDVSYVDGFTVPVVCLCGGKVMLGCNLDLNEMCPDQYRLNATTCINPHRDGKVQGVENIFKDCSPMAYTLPGDALGTINGFPGNESSVTCCVGTACPAHPLQRKCPTEGRRAGSCSAIDVET
ncbi:hypothetical protein F5X99DRAFT_275644 [Biscogniauxia marginata]|nr:hypothetical protein F5X99DRAFT_275644 [Biscogniauxia marginata]